MTTPLLANWRAKGVVCEEIADTRSIVSEVGDRADCSQSYEDKRGVWLGLLRFVRLMLS